MGVMFFWLFDIILKQGREEGRGEGFFLVIIRYFSFILFFI